MSIAPLAVRLLLGALLGLSAVRGGWLKFGEDCDEMERILRRRLDRARATTPADGCEAPRDAA